MNNNFFAILESDLSIEIPNFVKNSLELCGFANAISLKDCTDEDISDVEKFMREEFSHIMQKRSNGLNYDAQMVDYFGELYGKNPSQFEFKSGHRKVIKGLVSHVQHIINSNEDGGLKHFMEMKCADETLAMKSATAKCTHYFLDKLVSNAKRNESRQKNGYRYDSDSKSIGTYLRLITGPFAYETIQRNLDCSLPSLSSTNRYISSYNCHIVEGIVRSSELQKYLNDRKLPLVISLSLDETRIEDDVQYDAKTNQIVGFTLPLNKSTGLPIPLQYPARNAMEIMKHFSIQHPISSNLNVVMAQPLAQNTPAFCLLAYGTDKRYNTADVYNQWKHITEDLASLGIQILTISSDSDPKYNGAMRYHSKLGIPSKLKRCIWFSSAASSTGPFCIQDIEHIATKLRNFILRTIWNLRKLPFGRNNFIELKHMEFIMNKFRKDRHELTKSVLNPADKQNFKSVERMCSNKVIKLLKLFPKCHATMHFLTIIQDVIAAFRNRKLSPLERVKKMWYNIFLVRLWRRYILRNSHYTLDKNFLTSYTYICIELNGHSLVQIMLYLREINQPEWFLPHLFGSQQCENIFRQLRSLSSTYSTITNCSTKEALSRLSKIEIQNDLIHSTQHFKFPRHEAKNKIRFETFPLPSFDEIVQVIEQCATDAIEVAQQMNLITEKDITDKKLLACKINPYSLPNNVKETPKSNLYMRPFKLSDFNGLTLKDFSASKHDIDESGPYVELCFDNNRKRTVVRKSTFVWMLRTDKQRLSSDRLRRVQCTSKPYHAENIQKSKQSKETHARKKVLMYPYKKPKSKKM